MSQSPGKPESPDDDEERPRRAAPRDAPRPEPGVTSPLDDLAEDERDLEPVGVMPGAGPDPPSDAGREPEHEQGPDSEEPAREDEASGDVDPDRA